MGQKSNPIILRLNKTNQHWNSCWYSDDNYATPFLQDCKINAYINSSQQQLERFSPISFVKRQRGDLQIALFSAKPAQQFFKFKHNKYKNSTSHLITHNIFKKWVNYEKLSRKDYSPYDGLIQKIDGSSSTSPSTSSSTSSSTSLMTMTRPKKEKYIRSQLLLTIITKYNALKAVLDKTSENKVALNWLYKKTPTLSPTLLVTGINKVDTLAKDISVKSINLAGTANKRTVVKVIDPTRNHLEYSICKYYNEYQLPFAPIKSKLYLVKSPSIYQNPLFLASQVVSLLEDRAVFRQIKHRVIREIRKNPIIKGVRIICSGRVASRSKKAQKARRESIQWGATSLNVFSEHVNFASCFAQTTFGKIGVKVWISYNFSLS